MPFIAPKQRDKIKKKGISACEEVGDICYVFYSQIMQIWRKESKWRTAHRLYRDYVLQPNATAFFRLVDEQLQDKFEPDEIKTAAALAYNVFFQTYVMEYEAEKKDQNGDI